MIEHAYLQLFDNASVHKELDIAYGSDKHITNSKIRQETMKIVEGISTSNELKFGSIVASSFDIQLAISTDNLMDEDIEVSVIVNHDTENVLKIGKYKVVSDKPTADRLYKNIKAYDALYQVINLNVADWYEALSFPITMKAFRDSFFAYVGIEQVEVELINDNMLIEKTISTNSLTGQKVMSAICELNGAFGRLNRDGKFVYIFLEPTPTERINISKYVSGTGSYEDFETHKIGTLQIRQNTNDIGVIVQVINGGDNTYIIQDNFLVYGKGNDELTTIATNTLKVIKDITYRPFSGIKTLGNPCYEVGDAVTIPTRNATVNSYILNRTLSGIQALRDTYSAEGQELNVERANSPSAEMLQLKRQTNELTRTVEETKSVITSVEKVANDASSVANDAEAKALNAEVAANLANKLASDAETTATTALTASGNNSTNIAKLNNRVTTNESSIKQQSSQIESKVSKTDYTGEQIASLINQSAEEVKIQAEHIKLEGTVTANDAFVINEDGSYQANIGVVGGWTTDKDGIYRISSESENFSGTDYGFEYVYNNETGLYDVVTALTPLTKGYVSTKLGDGEIIFGTSSEHKLSEILKIDAYRMMIKDGTGSYNAIMSFSGDNVHFPQKVSMNYASAIHVVADVVQSSLGNDLDVLANLLKPQNIQDRLIDSDSIHPNINITSRYATRSGYNIEFCVVINVSSQISANNKLFSLEFVPSHNNYKFEVSVGGGAFLESTSTTAWTTGNTVYNYGALPAGNYYINGRYICNE